MQQRARNDFRSLASRRRQALSETGAPVQPGPV